MKINQLSKLGPLGALMVGMVASGCSAMSTNDNPITTEHMAQIRAKEAAGRAHFDPSAQPGAKSTAGADTATGGN